MVHVPQMGHNPDRRNPYHEPCPTCGAGMGQYCRGRGTEIDGVGFVAHRARIAVAEAAEPCPVCLANRTDEEIAQEWDQIADECEAGSWDGYSPRLQQIIAGIARNTAANLRVA